MANRRQHLSALSVLLLVLALPLVIYGAMSVKSETTDMLQWLPGEQKQRETYDQFVSRFGHDDVTLTLQSAKTVTKLARCPLQAERTRNRSVVTVGVW